MRSQLDLIPRMPPAMEAARTALLLARQTLDDCAKEQLLDMLFPAGRRQEERMRLAKGRLTEAKARFAAARAEPAT